MGLDSLWDRQRRPCLRQAPAEGRTIFVPAVDAILLGFAVWASAGVRRGERLGAAAGVLISNGVMALIAVAVLLALGGEYKGSPVRIAGGAVLFAAWLYSLVMVLRAKAANRFARDSARAAMKRWEAANPKMGLIVASVGVVLLALGFLLGGTGGAFFVILGVASPLAIVTGLILSAWEMRATGSDYAPYGIAVGCLGLVACIAIIVAVVLWFLEGEWTKAF